MSKQRKADRTSGSTDKKISLVSNMRIWNQKVAEIHSAIANIHQGPKTGLEPRGALIAGPAGTGKTVAIKYYASRFPNHEGENGSVVPMLSISAPALTTIKGVASRLLDCLGDTRAYEGTITSQTMWLQRLMERSRVELVLMDEVQHMLNSPSSIAVLGICDWFTDLLNTTGVPIIFAGAPDAVHILDYHPGLARKVTVIELNPFDWESQHEQATFKGLLRTIEANLPFKQLVHLYSPEMEMALRFYQGSEGVMSHLMGIVRAATELAKGYSSVVSSSTPNRRNPFLMDISELSTYRRECSNYRMSDGQDKSSTWDR